MGRLGQQPLVPQTDTHIPGRELGLDLDSGMVITSVSLLTDTQPVSR